jgi:hypothetical protein
MKIAYADACARSNTDASRKNIGGGTIGGETLPRRLHVFVFAGVTIASDITFEGGPDDVFIIQIETPTPNREHACVSLAAAHRRRTSFGGQNSAYIGADASMQGIILSGRKLI